MSRYPLRYTILLKISLAGVCLMFALPYLSARHYPPIPSFYAEWVAAVLLLVGGLTLLSKEVWTRPLIPKITLLPMGLIVIALLQLVTGQNETDQPETLIFFLLYLVGAAFAMVVGQSLRQSLGLSRLAKALASFLLVGALASALIAIIGKFDPRWLPLWIENTSGSSILLGNLMQRNHLGNYTWLGIGAACFLYNTRRLHGGWLAGALMPLLLAAAMTSSRSSLIYLAGMNLLALLWWYRSRSTRSLRALVLTGLLIPVFLATQGLSPLLGREGEFPTAVSQVSDEVSSAFLLRNQSITTSSIKLLESTLALIMFADKPWLGNGVGSYFWGSFALAEQFPASFQGHAEHAHNLVAHLLAELGIGSLLLLVGTLTFWWRGYAVQKWNATHLWVLTMLMVEGWHSMVEYPLWYTYFLLPAALLLGAADTAAITIQASTFLRRSFAVLLLSGAVILHTLRSDYLQLEYALIPGLETGKISEEGRRFSEIYPRLRELRENSLFAPYVELIYAMTLVANSTMLDEKMVIVNRSMRFRPASRLVFKYALLLALAGRTEEAVQQQRWSIRGYPDELPNVITGLRTLIAANPTLPYRPLLQAAEAEAARRKAQLTSSNN